MTGLHRKPLNVRMTGFETSRITSEDGTSLAVYTWPAADSRGVVQLTHGMGEHMQRYAPFAEALNAAGWTVVGQDNRGHGASIAPGAEPGVLGEGGWSRLVADISLVLNYSRSLTAGPVVLFAHSLGSFAAQQFIATRGDQIDGLILSGTGAVDLLEPALDLDAEFDLALFNGPFAPARTDYDWLSRDDAEVDKYIADPLCGFGLDVTGIKDVFAGARTLVADDALAATPKDLPVLIAVGDKDPVNAELALVHALVARYQAAGMKDVDLKIYPGARHELTNETNKAEVFADIANWLERYGHG